MKCSLALFTFLLLARVKDGFSFPADKGHQEEAIIDEIIEVNKGSSQPDLFEGDMILGPSSSLFRVTRDATRGREYLWQNKIIPYEISSDLKYVEDLIKSALQEFENKTCLKFHEKTSENNWIKFVLADGCFSSVGKVYWRSGPQEISLAKGCLKRGTIIHEVMHSLGFWHEQSRPDRNDYVEIFWENIESTEITNFNRYSHQVADVLGVEYDYSSIMHYGRKAFSANGKETIVAIRNSSEQLGQRESLSEKDVIQINALYDCHGSSKGTWSSWSAYGPCNEACIKKRQRFCFHDNPQHCGQANEYGVDSQTLICTRAECYAPVDGHWGRWQMWSSCDKNCGLGTRKRFRTCDDPPPKNGGKSCLGPTNQSKECILKTCGLGPDDCEFDGQQWCFWRNDVNNGQNYFWTRNSGPTSSSQTGPDSDHTSGKGYYLYAESSAPASKGDKARIVSQEFQNSGPLCLQFWYHMFGNDMGSLRVFLYEDSKKMKKLWEKQGNQGNKWLWAEVTLESAKPFKVVFETERGTSFLSDIAIDDVLFVRGGCGAVKMRATKCSLQIKKLGCYLSGSPFLSKKILLDNHRDEQSSAFHGPLIDWRNFTLSLETLVCHCASRAETRGLSTFGIVYYGECWAYEQPSQNKTLISVEGCVDVTYHTCITGNDKACSGTSKAHYVYTIR